MFAGVLDWLIWGRLPDRVFVAGAVLVVVAATLALRIRSEGPAAGVVDPSLRNG